MRDFIIKVCGITTVEDALAAVESGANALGLNFYAGSPRCITPAKAAEIASSVAGRCLRVGVFVNASESDVRRIAADADLDVVQLHGVTPAVRGLRNWRAAHATDQPKHDAGVEAWLLDTFSPAFGGSGKTFDWWLATQFPYRMIVAGGLDAANVAEAIRITNPWGVDACSRLELQPGRKDRKRVEAFISAALAAFHSKQEVKV
jgi:phosphoribosylanthranilate isomerase